jgi:hypothetical protein
VLISHYAVVAQGLGRRILFLTISHALWENFRFSLVAYSDIVMSWFVTERNRGTGMSRKESARRRATPASVFEKRFEAALSRFAANLLETAPIEHQGLKGKGREHSLATFFEDRLPGKYGVTSGIVVDAYNAQSPQLDVLLFDQTRDFAFSTAGEEGISVLASEALLASVEVKSRLTTQELEKSCIAARRLRALRPFRRKLIGADVGEENGSAKRARYHHSIFAFATDLTDSEWLRKEATRLRSYENTGEHLIDAIYVFKRGLINPTSDRGMCENETGAAIAAYYFSLLNFIQREGGRRAPTPYGDYASLLRGSGWKSLGTKVRPSKKVPGQTPDKGDS